MRIKLKEGKQKELILSAKKDLTWKELSLKLNLCENYLCNELKKEKRHISKENYILLCKIAKSNFDCFIEQELEDNWGKVKGGSNSTKNIKEFVSPQKSSKLAEVFGIILGDGHVSNIQRGKKIRVYCIRIAGNARDDKDYIYNYIPCLFKEVFNETGSMMHSKSTDCAYFTIYGKKLIEFLNTNGLDSGNKVKNNQGIPNWIKENKEFLQACIRGLIDTDGSIHCISKENRNLRIDFTNHSQNLLNDAREGLINLGFTPSKLINNNHFFLSKQLEIERYFNDVGFGNSKNLKRFRILK